MNLYVCYSNTEQHKTEVEKRRKKKKRRPFIIDTHILLVLIYVRYILDILFFSINDYNFK